VGLSFPGRPFKAEPTTSQGLVQQWNDLVVLLRSTFGNVPRTVFVEMQLRTGATNSAAFPLDIALPAGMTPRTVTVGFVRNVDVPETQAHTQAVFVDWRPSPTGITVRYITGLFSGAYAPANWQLTLRIDGD
jgi:hypothetical protein